MLLLLQIIGLKILVSSVWNMLLVFRSMLPPSHWQNKALQLAAWLLFFSTNRHANVLWSSAFSSMHRVYKLQHTTHTEHILFCPPSSQPSSCRLKTLFPSYSSHLLPFHRLFSCLALSSSPPFLHPCCPSAEQQREAAIDAHALSPFFIASISRGREREQIITGEGERMRGKKSTNITSRH